MLSRISLCCLLIFSVETIAAEETVLENSPGRFLSIAITDDENELTKRRRTVVRMQIPEEGEFSWISGGEPQLKRLGQQFVGYRIKGNVVKQSDREVDLQFEHETAERVEGDDAETEVITSRKLAVSTRLEIGKQKIIRLGGKRRCTICVE